jgi:hypothetical protein
MRDGGKAIEVGRELINECQEGVKVLKKNNIFPAELQQSFSTNGNNKQQQ